MFCFPRLDSFEAFFVVRLASLFAWPVVFSAFETFREAVHVGESLFVVVSVFVAFAVAEIAH